MGRNSRQRKRDRERLGLLQRLQLLRGISESSKAVKKPTKGVLNTQHISSRPREVISSARGFLQQRYAAQAEPAPVLRHLPSQNPLIRGQDTR